LVNYKKNNTKKFKPFEYPEVKQTFYDLFDTLFSESGRGAILIATAHVEEHLTSLIVSVLPKTLSNKHKDKLFKYPGQLSSFSSKIELAYIFRLVNKNLYDSLNTLRKIRNDAAHTCLNFQLQKLNKELKSIYELGPYFANFIYEISTNALLQHKVAAIKEVIENLDLTEQEKKDIAVKILTDENNIKTMEEQVPFWELLFGVTFLCSLITHSKYAICELTQDVLTLSDLLKNDKLL
jgi:hypothetical protein